MSTRASVVREIGRTIAALTRSHPVRVAVDGVDAVGKTTLADELAHAVATSGRPVIRASVDGFHHPAAIRHRRGALSPAGYFHDSFDYGALAEHLLEPLGPCGSRRFKRAVFDYRNDRPLDIQADGAPADAVLIFDGVFLHRSELRGYFDFSLFLAADFETTLSRALARDSMAFGGEEETRRRYAARYIPGQRLYLDAVAPARLADVVIDNTRPDPPVIVGRRASLDAFEVRFVVISGVPGSGKTRLGRRLATLLNMPLIDKDDILERLFDTRGVGDAAWRRQLSRESDELFQAEALACRRAVLVSFWHLPGMPVDSGTPTGWIPAPDEVVTVRCLCPTAIAASRFHARRRHVGHLDAAWTYDQVYANIDAFARLAPLARGRVIDADTSGEPDADRILRGIVAASPARR
jgi:uridine kinase